MMYTQSRKRKWVSPFSSFLSDSFLLFSLHFPLPLNCQSNCERKKTTHSEDPNYGASSSSTLPHGGDFEGGGKQREGNNYEVFLSFRGEDTRKGFTDHLHTRLVDAGIHVFRDDDKLQVGEEIGPELFRSISQSKISIPIISESYASSKWCLRELALILKCKRERGQTVLPIFYKVEPRQVRHLLGTFGDAINAHKKNLDQRTVQEWVKALEDVTCLKGLESEKTDSGYEGKFVETVLRKVVRELKKQFLLNVPDELVGIDDRVEHIVSLIDAKCNDTRMISICGMGGIGKTTLAKVLYNKLSSRYEYRSFVADIRETSKRESIVCVQKKLISDILRDSWDVSNVDEGINVLKIRFTKKKVLIILDDVDKDTRLDALVGDGSWFKAGSIVILTTRDQSILDKATGSYKYPLNELAMHQSLVLFSRHAFGKDSPPTGYEVISSDIVSTTRGLPLALEVIGSFLCGKTKAAWKDTSKKLKKVPHEDVQKRLRISYDALTSENKQMFLDIACFFIGSSKQYPTYMWDACDYYPGKGIEELSLLSLINIEEGGHLWMHDQLRDMGREIVRLENEKELGKRSRLWNYDDALEVLGSNKGTSEIVALELSMWGRERSFKGEQFKELTNLRFLQATGANFTGDFQNLLPRLNWLEWRHCPRDFTVTNFQPQKLIVLDLSLSSNISENWGGWDQLKMATELKVLDLWVCESLRRTPNLSAFKSLEILILEACRNLEEIHPSIWEIKTLISLNVRGCCKLKELPAGVDRMEESREPIFTRARLQESTISRGCLMKLETLLASECVSLSSLPDCIGHLASLTLLDLKRCDKLDRLPDSIGSLVSLQRLNLARCRSLREIPDSIRKLTSLTELNLRYTEVIEEFPESIGFLKDLKTLDARYCVSLACIPSSIGGLTSLSSLNLEGCDKLDRLPDSIGSLVSLQRFNLAGCCSLREIPDSIRKLTSLTELNLCCTKIVEFPESICFLKDLKTLDACDCESLACIPSSIGGLTSLSSLNLEGCDKLDRLPDSIGSLVSLQRFNLAGCCSLREIPDSIRKLTSLTELNLCCTEIVEFPESICFLKDLKTLDACDCESLACIPSSIGGLTSLSSLDLEGCHKLDRLPDSIGSLVSLQRLNLNDCYSLREIPDSIGKLTSLTELNLCYTEIVEFPESIGFLKDLKILYASYCESLTCIPSSIGGLASLSSLDLEGCFKLDRLPDSIGSLVSLQRLNLIGCCSLREDLIEKLVSLTELNYESIIN